MLSRPQNERMWDAWLYSQGDDRYVQSHVVAEKFDPARLGFFSESGSGVFRQPAVWGMR